MRVHKCMRIYARRVCRRGKNANMSAVSNVLLCTRIPATNEKRSSPLMSGGELRSTGDGLVGREGKGWQESLTRGAASRRSSSKREHVATPLHTDTEIRFESHRDQAFTSLRHTCTLTHTCHTSFIWQCFSSLVAPSQPR